MKIELRRISHNSRLSQETEAFAADLYIDGKKRGTVENDGHGGSHNFSDWNAAKELNEYGKTLPRLEFPKEWGKVGDDNTYGQSAESLVDDALSAHLKAKQANATRKQLLRAMTTKTLFRKPGDGLGVYSYFKGTDERILKHIAAKYPDATIITPANLDLIIGEEVKADHETANA